MPTIASTSSWGQREPAPPPFEGISRKSCLFIPLVRTESYSTDSFKVQWKMFLSTRWPCAQISHRIQLLWRRKGILGHPATNMAQWGQVLGCKPVHLGHFGLESRDGSHWGQAPACTPGWFSYIPGSTSPKAPKSETVPKAQDQALCLGGTLKAEPHPQSALPKRQNPRLQASPPSSLLPAW